MKKLISIQVPRLAILCILSSTGLAAGDPRNPGGENPDDKLLLYAVEGILTADLSESLQADIAGWLEREPAIHTLILKINSPGTENGLLEPAESAAKFLANLRGVRVIAWIGQDRVAGGASALLALVGRELVMSPGARLGYIPEGEKQLEVPEGKQQEAAGIFRDYSTLRRGPIGKSHLAASMVSRDHPIIYKVRFDRRVGGSVEEEIRFLTSEEQKNMDPGDRHRRKPNDVPVVPAGQMLTLDPQKAFDYGFAELVGSGELDDVLDKLKLTTAPQNIIDHERGGVLKPNNPTEQLLVDFFTHPVVRFLLLLVGTLGLLLEFKMPGTLVPSLTGLACFAVFFVAGFYQPTEGASTVSLFELLLFVIGMCFIGVELLLLPGVIIIGLSGAAMCLISIVLAMVPDSSSAGDYRNALAMLLLSSGMSAVTFFLILRFLPHSRFLDKSGIVIHSAIQGTPSGDSTLEAQTKAAALLGKRGKAITPLRPSGTMEVEGERIDVVAQGDFVERGEEVEIVFIEGTRTQVKKV